MKSSVTFEGMDCINDLMLPQYAAAHKKSLAEIPWASNTKYGKYTVYFGIVVIFIAFVKHLWYLYRDYRYKNSKYRHQQNYGGSFVSVLLSYGRFVGYKQIPPVISWYTSLPPSVGKSLFLFVSALYLFCYSLVPHFWYRGCYGFGSPPLAIRSGIMATALTPFIYVLLGKANMITVLTGISHEKLNTFHQFVGVACLVLSLIHTIAFMYQPYKEGGSLFLALQFTSFSFYSGIAPLVLLIWLCVASKAFIRKKLYEIFLHMHWMVAIAYFATLWVHIDNTLDMQDYMYGALAFWGTQVLYRIFVKTCFKPNKMFMRGRPAKLTRLNENTFEVVIENLTGYSNWQPGQHVFLRFVGTHFLDNHPFSIASMNGQMKFIIVAKKGLTGVLHKQLDDYVTKEKTVYIDGPYGGVARDPLSFDRIILLGTGSGVTATLPFLLHVANAVELKKVVVTTSISFIWVIRSTDDISWVKNELTHCKQILGDMLDLSIYVAEQDLEKHLDSDLTKVISTLNIEYYKPSIVRLVKDLTPTLLTRNMIVSSGSDSMRRDVSSVVSNMQPLIFNNDYHQTGIDEIFLHTEAFCW